MKKSLSLIAIAAFLLAAGQVGAYPTLTEMEKMVGNPAQYALFHFQPETPIAEIIFASSISFKGGHPVLRWGRALARGAVRLPTNSELQINLRYDGLAHMDQLDQLSKLPVGTFNASDLDFDDGHMKHLQPFKNLHSLDLKDTLISDGSLALIGSFTKLAHLNINSTNVTGAGLDNLKSLKKLVELSIEGLNMRSGAIFKLKPLLPGLVVLRLNRCNLNKTDMTILKDLRDIKELTFSNNMRLDNDCIQYLKGLPHLKVLDISDTAIDEGCIPQLSKLPALIDVRVRDKLFWKHSKHPAKVGKIAFADVSKFCDAQGDLFKPLH